MKYVNELVSFIYKGIAKLKPLHNTSTLVNGMDGIRTL